MRTNRYIRVIVAMLLLHVCGAAELWAITSADIIIQVMPSGKEGNGAVTTAPEGKVSASVSGQEVTLTVTPNPGYKIKTGLIVVEKMVNPDVRSSARRRTPGMGTFELSGSTDDWVTSATEYTFTIPTEYDGAFVTATFVPEASGNLITSLSEIVDLSGSYVLARDVDASGFASLGTFTGTLDGQLHTIYNLSAPLFSTLTGTVKNVILDDVNINGTGNIGAIASTANGAARIYNCGILDGSVGGTAYTGGLVGLLDGTARVINCYSYATITRGSDVGGIVGYNNGTTNASSINTMVMNCMFYGDITGGTKVSPVYGGKSIDNLRKESPTPHGLNTFNYYAYSKLKGKAINSYNCALAVEDKYLNRFEFYRLLLNSNKRLAAFYATGSAEDAETKMAKWVLETADRTIDRPKPYPVLKAQGKYPSIINPDVEHAPDSTTVGPNKGGKLGTKTVTVHLSGIGITTSTLELPCTDKDFDRFNFNYDKIQLPYFNDVGTGNYTDKVVTGWKITSVTGGTPGTYTTGDKWGGYNFADRNCTNKDVYGTGGSNRVFSQGAYYDVPYGVTDIYIEPYWGTAAYVADKTYDVVYDTGYGKQEVLDDQVSSGAKFNGQTIYTSISSALATLSGATVYDNAIVLVGNLHQNSVPQSDGSKRFTIMSVDEDHDNEPDYSMIYHHSQRTAISPIRFDFLNVPGTAQAQKPKDAGTILNFTICKTRGWFETTNTTLIYSNQVEYENLAGISKEDSPFILMGGEFEQFVSTQRDGVTGKTQYIHVGGNVYIERFGLGTHSDGDKATPHIPVSVTGGDFKSFYLSGTYNQDAAVKSDNAECYISSGRFEELAGAAQEKIDGNVGWQIYNADIKGFYGGGVNAAKPVTGDVSVDIYNSHVETYCGGPKFGDMQPGKTVTTNAYGCEFGTFFGGGFGGTSYSTKKYYDETNTNAKWNGWDERYKEDRGKYFDGIGTGSTYTQNANYGNKGIGVATDFEYEAFVWSTGTTGGRFYVKFASFSLATCNDVTSKLESCHITKNFYGGGSFGEVKGKASSTLDGCTVDGNVFGGGYSAELPKVEVRDAGFEVMPYFNASSGMFERGVESGTTTFTWRSAAADGKTLSNNTLGSDLTNHYLYTNVDLTALGKVGATDLTVKGNTKVTGGVFGGGDMSAISPNTEYAAAHPEIKGDTKVTVQTTGERTITNVYGGGNTADVDGDATVTMTRGAVSQDVFGGGRGETTTVSGDVTVSIGPKAEEGHTLTIRNVYGGSALGAVNATKGAGYKVDPTDIDATAGKATTVNINGGTVSGSVFGGGLGQTSPSSIAAQNFTNTAVNMTGGTVRTAVYGGANVNGVLKGNATVTITGGTVGSAPGEGDPIADVVFGGGKGEPTLVNGDVTVEIGTMTPATPPASPTYTGTSSIYGNVYGGSALGNTNASKTGSDPMVFYTDGETAKATAVNLYAGTIYGNVFGGGLGQKNGVNGASSDIVSYVGGNVFVTLDGAKLDCTFTGAGDNRMTKTGQIFGANNLNGTPKGHVKVHVKRTIGTNKPTVDDTDAHNPIEFGDRPVAQTPAGTYAYDVAAVYGGGNQADYIPTKASGSAADKEEAFAEVLIEGCDKTSIEYVYGGGNAAAVPATRVTVLGTYIIDQLFGGGNGKSTETFTNPGADVGKYNNGESVYGTGVAETRLIGGNIHVVYGGSNTKGNVRGGTRMTMPENDGTGDYCENMNVKEIYGAGKSAEQDGGVTIILGCVKGMDYVYGGAMNANVKGGVDLVITSGHFKQIYGGNDTSGTIQGPITLTIEETGCEPINIEELYLGGKLAAYSVYGYYLDDTTLEPRTSLSDHTATAVGEPTSAFSETQWYADPQLNVVSCTNIGKVFGGGYQAALYGNPEVNINQVPGKYAVSNRIGTIGDVSGGGIYGGGSEADVYGSTKVNIGTESTTSFKSNVTDNPETDEDESHPYVRGAKVVGNVYGGGLAGNVVGSTQVNIGTVEYTTEGYEGVSITGNVFGGGEGETTKVTNNVEVNIGTGSTGNATITGDVYGGSALGSVNSSDNATATEGATTSVTLNKGTITGSVYGGGLGERNGVSGGTKDVVSNVYGEVTVTVNDGTVSQDVYGANNLNGSPRDDVSVVIAGGTITGNVYGGGNLAAYNDAENAGHTLSVTMSGGSATDVFGGGLGSSAVVNGNTSVTLSGGTVTNDVYGGGSEADVTGAVSVALNGGTVGRDAYGGGALAETNTVAISPGVYPATSVTLAGATVTRNVYGGGLGKLGVAAVLYTAGDAEVIAGTKTVGEVKTPAVSAVAADVLGPITVAVSNGTVSNVFGCNNVNGSPLGTVTVNVSGGKITNDVYGGGNQAAYTYAKTAAPQNLQVNISGGTMNNVYGGGLSADVAGGIDVNITGGTITNDVYGGGALANTNTANWDTVNDTWIGAKNPEGNTVHDTNVTLTGGTMGNVYGGALGAHEVPAVGEDSDPGYVPAVPAIEPNVYGDITVTVNKSDGTGTARFTRAFETHSYIGHYKDAKNVEQSKTVEGTVYTKGSVFGANNKEGTPKGNIQVTVWSTTPIDYAGSGPITHTYGIYEIQNVYGGGNLSAYVPTDGKTTKVDIHGCDRTSIQFVFGGGNAAAVPVTHVTIFGSYEIETVFGGGNGSQPVWSPAESKWVESPGATVETSNVSLKGGYLHSAFGGSYERGTVTDVNLDKSGTGGECALIVTDIFGGGKDADVEKDINLFISNCAGYSADLIGDNPEIAKVKNVYAGSYNARIFGNVTLTMTSGNFTNVFGGNHTSGFINGTITVNIEETRSCEPLIIENLYGGGNYAPYPGPGANYANPKITVNVKAATRIGKIYGGCNHADADGDVEVNINMIKGWWAGRTYTDEFGNTMNIPDSIGVIGDVYGGGNEGHVLGKVTVNIGTEKEVALVSEAQNDPETSAKPTHMEPKRTELVKEAEGGNPAIYQYVYDVLGAKIKGNVFGGCNQAHVKRRKVSGDAVPVVYAPNSGNTEVNISTADYSGAKNFEGVSIDKDAKGNGGSVYGGGYVGDVLGNTKVKMGGGYIFNGIFGGGYSGSVGTFERSKEAANIYGHTPHAGCIGKPISCEPGTGKCTVVVDSGQVGPIEVATLGMTRMTKGHGDPVPEGWIWGGGRGLVVDPADNPDMHFQAYVDSTDVTIGGTAFILESVIGGGEFGRVLGSTHVKIKDHCQIGVGAGKVKDGKPVRYTDGYDYGAGATINQFIDPTTTEVTPENKLTECSHYPFGRVVDGKTEYLPYDPYYDKYPLTHYTPGSTDNPSDGKTWIGLVFGGGSGYFPYEKSDGTGYEWCPSAGIVEGNTLVEISGGHILTNVYGGNEYTDVKGKATVRMTGGTVGLPRTLTQIANCPTTGYIFGAGKGDERSHFNQMNSVGSVEVDVSGGIIYGSIFGGAEEGHVTGDVVVNVSGGKIGTWGTSYVDGNVFGGGRGFGGTSLNAGNVGGSVAVNISGGTMLGFIYGGGRLASVGYDLVQLGEPGYGEMSSDPSHGNVTIDISGGTIGNNYEYAYEPADKTKMPQTLFDSSNRLMHTKGGNVFAGGMGRREKLGSTTDPVDYPGIDWRKFGNVKSTKLTIRGTAWIKGNVYGGGEFGAVTGSRAVLDDEDNPVNDASGNPISAGTEIIIKGGTIGMMMQSGVAPKEVTSSTTGSGDSRYTFGSVYGGGYGTEADAMELPYTTDVEKFGAYVNSNTYINMSGTAKVRASVYGGGEMACVKGNTYVDVSNGEIGIGEVRVTEGDKKDYVLFGSWKMGNVYGGGKGSTNAVCSGLVAGNSDVNISGGSVFHNVYGGGAYSSVGTYTLYTDETIPEYLKEFAPIGSPSGCADGTGTARVTITGGTIGINGWDNGMVNGSGRGDVAKPVDAFDPHDRLAWVNKSIVTIGNEGSESSYDAPQPQIKGSVYGGGENGHNFGDSEVHVYSGTIGTDASASYDNANVYGAGCGTDKYDSNNDGTNDSHNRSAGWVQGGSTVNIHGGRVLKSVYGGGSMASVSVKATMNISGGQVDGSVYGGSKGDINDNVLKAHAKATEVNVSGGVINGSVFGGGEYGIVENDVDVNMTGGTIGENLYGGGAMADTNTGNVTGGGGYKDNEDNSGKEIASTKTYTTHVSMMGGTVTNDVYGGALGKHGVPAVGEEDDPGYVAAVPAIEPIVYGDVLVELNGKTTGSGESVSVTRVADNAKGCIVSKVFGCNDLEGTPKGHVKVHVFATQNAGTGTISAKIAPASYEPVRGLSEKYADYLKRLIAVAKPGGTLLDVRLDAAVISAAETIYETYKDRDDASLTADEKSDITNAAQNINNEMMKLHDFDVDAVYGGGDLAEYNPNDPDDNTEVIIEGCGVTSIDQVYGGGNAAPVPATDLKVESVFIINELFGGGNGLDNYQKNGTWYQNPGANVGYHDFRHYVEEGETGYNDATHGTGKNDANAYKAILNDDADTPEERETSTYRYGRGEAKTTITGGHIHVVYGGSNNRGNISTMALSQYQKAGGCALVTDRTYGGSKDAEMDGEARVVLDCVENTGDFFGGSMNSDIHNNVTLNITNGTFGRIFGGNDKTGSIDGIITINIEERGCTPIEIGELYGGGFYAPYSVYGYKKKGDGKYETIEEDDPTGEKDGEGKIKKIYSRIPLKAGDTGARDVPNRDPHINIISATSIGAIYGGGYKAKMVGSPHINVNMTTGRILATYKDKDDSYATKYTVADDGSGDWVIPIGTIGNIYGGGNMADVIGNTYVEIGTGKRSHNVTGAEETITPARNAANISGMVFGGGKLGHVGDFTFDDDDSNDIPDGKPVSCAEGTGTCTVTVSNGSIGPDNMQMTSVGGPDDTGHVFGGGQGTADLYYDDTSGMSDAEKQTAIAALGDDDLAAKIKAVDNLAYVNNTEVTIDGTAFVKASVYGGGFDGHVLGDTHVIIDGDCQIGNGDGVNRPYTSAEWEDSRLIPQTGDPASVTTLAASHTNSLPECASWPYTSPYAPHDKFALFESGGKMYYDESHTKDAEGGSYSASDGHTFYGNVFAGGSGYYPYAPGKWLHKAGWVEGNTLLEIKGGHILTNVYGGNEMTNVGDSLLSADKGKCTIRMTGGTLGVPRTLAQIDAHPVTCYLFGAGKGDQIVAFNTETNVKEVDVEITGGRIYGSVFGGGEDGHVLGNVKMTIGNNDGTGPAIGTWGTSYVDGNVFGGGRGFSGNALTAGNVGGCIDLDIKGGTMLGSIYGGGRLGSVGYGLYAPEDDNYGKMRANANNDAGDEAAYYATKGRGHININISGGTIGNDTEYKFNPSADDKLKMPKTLFDASTNRLLHTKGGNVFAGGMGRRTDLAGGEISNWTQLGNAKSTTLTITGGTIKSNVYGGGEFGAVTSGETSEGGTTTITIDNVTIGTQIKDSEGAVKYTFGSVFGGGYGTEDKIDGITEHSQVNLLGALVTGNTTVSMNSGHVWASVLGGGELAAVGGNTNVTISGGEIGKNEVYSTTEPYYEDDSPNPGYVKYGSSTMGNVYGGGMGKSTHTLLGVVKGNTNVTINPGAEEGEPFIYHNVYGGGALGSVGSFNFSDGKTGNMANIPKGIPYHWDANTGVATVNIKGGTIGISGRDNGMVNGSSRGDVAKPVPTDMEAIPVVHKVNKDPYDKMAWVEQSIVNIGENATTGPHIKGSVYGGGENGHVFTHATVNVKSGTIGIVDEADTWFDFGDDEINKEAWVTRGNVYGAGCGTDTYKGDDGKEYHNAWAGCVIGNADVNISGGWVAQNVYGGGSMGSVGRVKNQPSMLDQQHRDATKGFAFSWPAIVEYQDLTAEDPVERTHHTGKTTVNITGGRIGTTGSDNGDIFGGSRGEAGDRYVFAEFSNTRETEVNINYTGGTPTDAVGLGIIENYDKEEKANKFSLRVRDGVNAICGSVYGGAENGHVNGDTKVTLTSGLIGHSVYGGGKGKGEYIRRSDSDTVPSLTAGKVYGNTEVIVEGGHVVRSIYGGGNLGSVGKGNYAGGRDDFYPDGYGEKLTGEDLWTPSASYNPDEPIVEEDGPSKNVPESMADYFLGSGRTDVKVKAGVVGFMLTGGTYVKLIDGSETTYSGFGEKSKLIKVCTKDNLPTGNVFGGCRGVAAPEALDTISNLAFFQGYVNQTAVTIGDGALANGPRIYGSVYGGGQDGHVRRGTNVTVNKGEIGMKYTPANVQMFGDLSIPETGKDNLHWLHRGNVYGGGTGIGTYTDGTGTHNTSSAGSVTHTTTVTVNNGITGESGTEAAPGNVIYRNIYGGGSLASVSPPVWNDIPNPDEATVGKKFVNTLNIAGTVGALTDYVEKYGGEVYGAGRGEPDIENAAYFAVSIWTKVNIKDGANIKGNVFGGGDSGPVLKNTEVIVGAE